MDDPTVCSCWNCDAFTENAEAEGWFIGHYDGQAYYACPACKNSVWDPLLLIP